MSARHYLTMLAAIWKLGAAEALAYRVSMLIWILTTTFPLVSLALWSTLAASGPIGNYDQADFSTYFVGAFVVRQATASWAVWDLEREIRLGELTPLLMRPIHPVMHHAAINLAALPIRMALALPLALVVLVAVDGFSLAESRGAIALVPFALALGWLINFCGQIAVACLAFWFTRASSLWEIWLGLYIVFSGYLVPTDLFPPGLTAVTKFLPFYSSLGFPVELAIGRLNGHEALSGLAIQLGWAIAMGLLAVLSWTRGIRRFGAVGI